MRQCSGLSSTTKYAFCALCMHFSYVLREMDRINSFRVKLFSFLFPLSSRKVHTKFRIWLECFVKTAKTLLLWNINITYILGKILKKAFTPIVMGLLYWFLEPRAIAQWGRNICIYHIKLNDVEKWYRFFFYFEELLLPYAKTNRPRKAGLAWQVSRYLWRGSLNFKIKNSRPLFTIIFKPKMVISRVKSLVHL